MIIRILGEGQFSVDDTAAGELNQLDAELASAIDRGDEATFRRALTGLLTRVRTAGSSPVEAGPGCPPIPPQRASQNADLSAWPGDVQVISSVTWINW